MSTLRPFRPKAAGPPRVVPRHIPASDGAAPTDPVLAAEAEAAAILIAAQSERERMIAEGYAEGAARAESELAELRMGIESVLGAIRTDAEGHRAAVARDGALLAIMLATELLGRAVEDDPTRVTAVAERVLAHAPSGCTALRVSPALAPHVADLGVEVHADAALQVGDVVAVGSFGEIDARRSSIAEQLSDALRDADA